MKTLAITVVGLMISLALMGPSLANGITWKEIYTRAGELYQAGHSADALEQARLAAAEAEKRFGSNSINAAKSLDLVAEISRAQGSCVAAAQLYNRSLGIQEKILGPAHPRVIKTICALAAVNAQQERLFEARALYEKARAGAEAASGGDDLDAVAPLVGLATLDQASGNYLECRQLCHRVLAIYHKYTKYQPNLAASIAGTLQRLAEVSSLQESRAQSGDKSRNAL